MTSLAGFQVPFPAWCAVMVQVPLWCNVTVAPLTVHTDGVLVVNVTARPEVAVAVTVKGD